MINTGAINIGVVSYTLGSIAFLALGALLLTRWRGRLQGGLLVQATLITALWAGLLAAWSGWRIPSASVVQALEALHFIVWFAFLFGLLRQLQKRMRLTMLLIYGLSAALLLLPLVHQIFPGWSQLEQVGSKVLFLGYVLLTVSGLFLVENLYRNTRPEQRWGIKFLCLGIGGMFAYEFFMYTEALLFNQLDMNLWNARGAVLALIVPLVGISVARKPDWSLEFFVSKNVAVYTVTLLVAGSYLLAMAAAGYYIRVYGGEWGAIIQIVFLFGAGAVLVALLFSGQLRARIKVFLGKHFFRHRYDYREQWQSFTQTLSQCKQETRPHECVVRAIAEVVDSPGGLLWLRHKDGDLAQVAHWGVSGADSELVDADCSLVRFLQKCEWVINLEEYREDPDMYEPLELPEWLAELPTAWLVVPLLDQQQLLGFMVISQPRARVPFNWELRDLLKTAASQAASHLAQLEAVEALAEARQFEGFHRLSAFVLHDLKNLIAQQSLVVNTAARHKHKPEFIDDAIEIMEHSVAKMQRLMQLLRTGISSNKPVATNLVVAVGDAVNNCSAGCPVPRFDCGLEEATVTMDRDRMTSVIENLVQNAQDATADDGIISVRLTREGQQAEIIIEDNGLGMDAVFVRERLFRPFDTTKGDTGMGIGAYECREYVQSLGGAINVDSAPEQGTRVCITLPLSAEGESAPNSYMNRESVG